MEAYFQLGYIYAMRSSKRTAVVFVYAMVARAYCSDCCGLHLMCATLLTPEACVNYS